MDNWPIDRFVTLGTDIEDREPKPHEDDKE